MPDRTERAQLRFLKYSVKHEKFSPGRPRRIDPAQAIHYADEIERALKKAGLKRLEELTQAGSAEGVAQVFKKIPESVKIFRRPGAKRTQGWHESVQVVLLGGWEWRGKTMMVFRTPERDKPPRAVSQPVTAQTLPELIFSALQDDSRPQEPHALLRFIAESVAAPAIWSGTSREYSRRICRLERRNRAAR